MKQRSAIKYALFAGLFLTVFHLAVATVPLRAVSCFEIKPTSENTKENNKAGEIR